MIVDLDEASLARFGQWPWSRTRVADLVSRLTEAGAAVCEEELALWREHAGAFKQLIGGKI